MLRDWCAGHLWRIRHNAWDYLLLPQPKTINLAHDHLLPPTRNDGSGGEWWEYNWLCLHIGWYSCLLRVEVTKDSCIVYKIVAVCSCDWGNRWCGCWISWVNYEKSRRTMFFTVAITMLFIWQRTLLFIQEENTLSYATTFDFFWRRKSSVW